MLTNPKRTLKSVQLRGHVHFIGSDIHSWVKCAATNRGWNCYSCIQIAVFPGASTIAESLPSRWARRTPNTVEIKPGHIRPNNIYLKTIKQNIPPFALDLNTSELSSYSIVYIVIGIRKTTPYTYQSSSPEFPKAKHFRLTPLTCKRTNCHHILFNFILPRDY